MNGVKLTLWSLNVFSQASLKFCRLESKIIRVGGRLI